MGAYLKVFRGDAYSKNQYFLFFTVEYMQHNKTYSRIYAT